MAGTAAPGQLNARAQRDAKEATQFAVATLDDEAELRELLRATPTPGGVSLRFEREPDYFAGENMVGARDTTIVARRGGRVVCMGRCSRRVAYWGGVAREVGYLGELRLRPGTPRGADVLREGYAFFAELEATRAEGPAEFYFTSVATENERARRVLESGRLGLPKYVPLGELVTVALPVPTRTDDRRASGDEAESRASEKELSEFLDREARRHALASPWTEASWAALFALGLRAEDFCVVRTAGRIVAAAVAWDQSDWRQTVVAGYAGGWRRARPWINAWARLTGRPGLPAEGARLRQAAIHPLAVAAGAEDALTSLLDALIGRATRLGVEWLVASVEAEDALLARLRRRRGARIYPTRLYAVELPTIKAIMPSRGVCLLRPEAGLL